MSKLNILRFFSYIFPQTLYRTSSKYNKDIRVQLVAGNYKLLVHGSRQSGEYIRKLWKKALSSLKKTSIQTVLVMGIGGGTVIKLLKERYNEAEITGVDIDPVMIEVGKKYFGLDKLPNLKLIRKDAKDYVKEQTPVRKKFDLIIIDIFSGRHNPVFLLEDEFLRNCKKLISKDSELIMNYSYAHDYVTKSERLYRKLKRLFGSVKSQVIGLNRFFFCQY